MTTRSKPERAGRYTVWLGTNRKRVIERGKIGGFSGERDQVAHYGRCRVAIPQSHKIGSIGSPWWKRLLTWTDDRLKLVRLKTLAEDRYWAALTDAHRVASEERDAVVFIHGFNVSFEQAALRAAQLGFDLGISRVMAFYSWPSQGTVGAYTGDEATIEASEGFITDYLTAITSRSGAEKITGHRSRELERYQHLTPEVRARTVNLIAAELFRAKHG